MLAATRQQRVLPVAFVLSHGASHLPPPKPVDALDALARIEAFWCGWAAQLRPAQPYTPAVVRSLVTLKRFTHQPSGSIVAAPTTSLAEQIGGSRNWDYRFCWIRDATFTLLAFLAYLLTGQGKRHRHRAGAAR